MSFDIKGSAKSAGGKVIGGLKDAGHWITGPFRTEGLLQDLADASRSLSTANSELTAEEIARDEVIMELRTMGAKTVVLNSLLTEVALFSPPQLTKDEIEHLKREEKIYDPLQTAYLITGGAMLVSMLPGLGVSIVRVLTFGKYLKTAKQGKLLTNIAKFTKGTIYLTAAIVLIESIIKMIHAEKLNKELEKARQDLLETVGKADRAYALVGQQRLEAEALRTEMLDDAGSGSVRDFLVTMNQAIAEVSAQAALVKVARNLLRMGQPPAAVVPIVQLEEKVVTRIERRLIIERGLIAGKSTDDILGQVDADPFEILIVSKVLAVRGDAARGMDDETLAETHSIVDAMADLQIDIATDELAKHWGSFPNEVSFSELANKTLIPEHSLSLLAVEMAAKADLWDGLDLEAVRAKHPDVSSLRISQMSEGLVADRELMTDLGGPSLDLAVQLRLPTSALGLIPG